MSPSTMNRNNQVQMDLHTTRESAISL